MRSDNFDIRMVHGKYQNKKILSEQFNAGYLELKLFCTIVFLSYVSYRNGVEVKNIYRSIFHPRSF
jgi:hypothetical protein